MQRLPLLPDPIADERPEGGWTVRARMAATWRAFWRDESGIDPITLFLISVALQIVGYLLAPRPRPPAPPSAEDIRAPTSEAGRPIPILWGDTRIQGPNVANFTDKSTSRRMVRVNR